MSVLVPDPAVTDWVPLGYGATVMPDVPSCKAYRSSPFACPNAVFTTVPFTAAAWDTNSPLSWSAANPTRLYCRTAGKYLAVGTGGFNANATGNHRIQNILHNGNVVGNSSVVAALSAGGVRLGTPAVANMNVGDYLELSLFQDSGAALNTWTDTGYGGPDLEMTYLGPGNLAPINPAATLPQPPVEGRWLRTVGGVPVWEASGGACGGYASFPGPYVASPYPSNPGAGAGTAWSLALPGRYLLTVHVSAFAAAVGSYYFDVYLDTIYMGSCVMFINAINTHTMFAPLINVPDLDAGTHYTYCGVRGGLTSDSGDRCSISLVRIAPKGG